MSAYVTLHSYNYMIWNQRQKDHQIPSIQDNLVRSTLKKNETQKIKKLGRENMTSE